MKKLNLKFTTITLVLLTVCISLNSCKKAETYNPERKIKKIYTQYSDKPKYLSQEWYWDNNKLVKIDYYSFHGYDIINTEDYIYEGNKLVKVQCRSSSPVQRIRARKCDIKAYVC